MTAYVQPINAEFIVPGKSTTKRLRFKHTGGKRKIVISSNWLPLYNFNPGDDMVTRPLGKNRGLVVELVTDLFTVDKRPKKIYQRSYTKRKNCPLEVVIEVASQKEINECFDSETDELHIKFEFNRLTITAIKQFKSDVLKNASKADPYSVFAACTSGVDLHLMEREHGYNIHSVIEWRMNEKRDSRDLSETGALSVLRNLQTGIKNLFNEDVTYISREQLSAAVERDPAMTFLASPCCENFSNVKARSIKEAHDNDLSSTVDMALDMLKIIECICPPIVKFEQVAGWYKSDAYKILSLRLRKYGYQENLMISSAPKFGGMTNRTRGYAVFSMLDVPFEFESESDERSESIWPIIEKHMPNCRDVTHSKSLQDGLRIGRLRTINPDSTKSPTFLRSQDHMAKDSCVISVDGKLYWPSEELIKELMGLEGFKTDCVSKSIGTEILGQSIDAALHSSVVRSLTRHIESFVTSIKSGHVRSA